MIGNIISEPFSGHSVCGYINKNNLTKWTIDVGGYSLKFLGRTVETNKPLIIGFHGWLNNQHFSFYDLDPQDIQEASVIFPQDRCGYLRAGSWYLGNLTSDNHYTYPSLIKIFIQYIIDIYKPSKIIAFGTSMGGFGAWSLSTFLQLDEVYLCVPQTTLSPQTHYFNRDTQCYSNVSEQYSKHLEALGICDDISFNALLRNYPFLDINYFSRLMNSSCNTQYTSVGFLDTEFNFRFSKYYHLISTRYDHPQDINGTYFRDMTLPLISSLSSNNIDFSAAIFPFSGHDAYAFPSQILSYSNNALSEVIKNKSQKRMSANSRLNSTPFWKPLLVS